MSPTPANNITALLDHAAERHPERTALVFHDQRVSFAELLTQIKQFAHRLTRKGIQPGERVIIMIPMSPELYVALLAVIRCGAVAVFVDPWIPMRQIAAFAAFATPSGFIGVPKSHLLRLLNPSLARVRISVSTGTVAWGIPARLSMQRLASEPADMPPAAVALDAPALITFTSGSSGTPKGANRTHGFLGAQHHALSQTLDYCDDDVDMPMFPVFALRNLAAGITSVVPTMDFRKVADVDATAINRQIQEHRVSLVTASPPFIDRLAELSDPPVLRKIFTGGAPVSDKQLEHWHAAFPATPIEIIYGSTEAEPVAHISSVARLATSGAEGFCCGKPTPLIKTCIVQIKKERIEPADLAALVLPQGETGELLVAGEHVCRDYFNNPAAGRDSKIIEPDGTCWHRMGDTGYLDTEGRFFLTGRVHTTIVRHGHVLHAQLVEAAIAKQIPEAIRVAALEQDGKLLIVIQGTPTPNPPTDIDADIIIVTEKPLPLDPRHNSKIDYTRLRQQLNQGSL